MENLSEIKEILSDAFNKGLPENRDLEEEDEIDVLCRWVDRKLWNDEFGKVNLLFKVLREDFMEECLEVPELPLTLLSTTNGTREDKDLLIERIAFIKSFHRQADQPESDNYLQGLK